MIALVFVGQTGSGKTTLIKHLEEALSLTRISSGDIARSLSKNDPLAKAELDLGHMAPELAMRAEILAQIEAATAKTGDFMIDGFPRTIAQLYILESVPQIKPLYFIVECDPLICVRRLVKRGREHDHSDAVATRMKFYETETAAMLNIIYDQAETLDGATDTDYLTGTVIASYKTALREI